MAFVISKIIKVHCKCYQPWPLAPLITLTLAFIILDITKISSNNCFLVVLYWTVWDRKQTNICMFLVDHKKMSCQK